MKYTWVDSSCVVSIERGEGIVSSLRRLCEEEHIVLGAVSGIGAAEKIELGYYNVGKQEYSTKIMEGEYEISALTGNITTMDDQVYLHLHITIGDKSFASYAGHLVEGYVSGACEIVIHSLDGRIDRYKDTEGTGLNLLEL